MKNSIEHSLGNRSGYCFSVLLNNWWPGKMSIYHITLSIKPNSIFLSFSFNCSVKALYVYLKHLFIASLKCKAASYNSSDNKNTKQ